MLTAEGKRKPIRAFTTHVLVYKIVRMLQRTINIQLKVALFVFFQPISLPRYPRFSKLIFRKRKC